MFYNFTMTTELGNIKLLPLGDVQNWMPMYLCSHFHGLTIDIVLYVFYLKTLYYSYIYIYIYTQMHITYRHMDIYVK